MQLLICGIPGTGKSEFSRWLVSKHRCVRCPQDEEPSNHFFDDVNLALDTSSDLIIDWGFPAFDPAFRPCMDFVRGLLSAGSVERWWFDGDRDAALLSYLRRGTASRSAWDRQIAGIDRRWSEICEVFTGRMLDVVSAGP